MVPAENTTMGDAGGSQDCESKSRDLQPLKNQALITTTQMWISFCLECMTVADAFLPSLAPTLQLSSEPLLPPCQITPPWGSPQAQKWPPKASHEDQLCGFWTILKKRFSLGSLGCGGTGDGERGNHVYQNFKH